MDKERLIRETIVLLSADIYDAVYDKLGSWGDSVDEIISLAEQFEERLAWQENDTRDYLEELEKFEKETIERLFGTAKENHNFRYTQMYGKARMEMKVGLTYACLNLKKLAKMLQRKGIIGPLFNRFSCIFAAA